MNQPTSKTETRGAVACTDLLGEARNLNDLLKKLCWFGYTPTHSEKSLIQDLLHELKAYREGGVTEEILRRNDGYIKVGRGCVITAESSPNKAIDETG